MKTLFATSLALVVLLAVCSGDVTDTFPVVKADASATIPAEAPMDTIERPDNTLTKLNATIAGNNVLVTRSNIIVIGDQAKKGIVDFIKNMVMKGSSPQDDDALSTQIITILSAGNKTAADSDLAVRMMPKIKSALQNRGKPKQLRQIIVKLTEMSPMFGTTAPNDHNA